jgi:hypothetical protein
VTRLPRGLVAALLALTLACGSTTGPVGPNGEPTPMPHADDGVLGARTEPPPPRPAAATLAVPASLVDAWLLAIIPSLPPMVPGVLEELLGPNGPRILQAPSPLGELGIDTAGMGMLMLAPVDPAQEPILQKLRTIAAGTATGQPVAEADFQTLRAMHEAAGPGEVRLRAVLPVADPAAVLRIVQALAREGSSSESMTLEGFDAAWDIDGELAVGIWHDASTLTIDVWAPFGAERRMDHSAAAAGLQRARTETIIPDPAVTAASGPPAARLTVDPAAVARVGALHGESMVMRAVASVSPDQRLLLVAAGIGEACRSFDLIENARGPIVRTIQAHARSGAGGLDGELRCDLGPGWPQDPTIWRGTPSLDFAAASMGADVDTRWLRTVQFPNGSNDHETWVRQIVEAGFWGYLLAMPLGGMVAVFEAADDVTDDMPLERFERVGAFLPLPDQRRPVVFGLLPAGSTRAEAGCALTPAGQPCAGRRLAVGRTVPNGTKFTRLVAVGARFVVLTADTRDDLDRAPRALTAGPVAPARLEVTEAALRAGIDPTVAAMAPGRTLFELASDGATLRTLVRTAALPTAIPAARP